MKPLENDSTNRTRDPGKPSLSRVLAGGGGAFLLWLLLTGSLAPAEIIVGGGCRAGHHPYRRSPAGPARGHPMAAAVALGRWVLS